MFDAISARYDLLNHLLSAGVDRRWRRRAIRALALTGRERVLDLCTGTGDLAIEAVSARPGARRVVGVDFAEAMLRVGSGKLEAGRLGERIRLVRGDATRLPVADQSVDAVTIAFGMRNVHDMAGACEEMRRVLTPQGRVSILEFAIPPGRAIRAAYLWYFNHLLPRIGRWVSRHGGAYGYLAASVSAFASPDEFVSVLRQHGFDRIAAVPLTLGIVFLYTAQLPNAASHHAPRPGGS
jgi:demethylmenaquinone methyltransferase/2-methoxy-6-polyprenyl-1,4-benzoquinol methylase